MTLLVTSIKNVNNVRKNLFSPTNWKMEKKLIKKQIIGDIFT